MNTTRTIRRAATCAAIGFGLLFSTLTTAAPKSELWKFWDASDEASATVVDHAAWTTLLAKHVNTDEDLNRVDYGALAESDADSAALDAYIKSLAAAGPRSLARAEQMPYWINLYNALTVQVVVDNWPVGSIRDISESLFSSGPWKRKLITIDGEELSLNDIEHRILRPVFNDSRVHYAVNCASIGCPNLQSIAFTRENTDALLTLGARQFINSPRGVVVAGDSVTVSSIYEWFDEDFGGNDAGVIGHLKQYADPALRKKLDGVTRIGRDQYDWRVNAMRGTAPGNVVNGSDDDGSRGEGS